MIPKGESDRRTSGVPKGESHRRTGGIGIIIQARLGSTRLPGKVMLPLAGQPVLWHVVNRCRYSTYIKEGAEIVVATTDQDSDQKIRQFCESEKILFFQGSEHDVLARYFHCAGQFKFRTVVRVTADCPVIDPEIMDQTIALHLQGEADYTTNRLVPTFPDGLDVDVLSGECLRKVYEKAAKKSEREHVVPYIWDHSVEFRIREYRSPRDLSAYRWVLDEAADYEFMQKLYGRLYQHGRVFAMEEILACLEKNQDWQNGNAHITRNEGYLKSIHGEV